MLGTEHLALFVVSGLLLNITPGQDTFYILGRTIAHGRRAGVFAVMGIVTGCMIARNRSPEVTVIPPSGTSMGAIFRGGVLSNVLNPKTALFFLAFLPQFVSPAAESRLLAFLFLGGVFIFNGTLWCLFLVWSAAAVRRHLGRGEGADVLLRRVTGVLFVGLGLRLGLSR